jgi:hypothetical protein
MPSEQSTHPVKGRWEATLEETPQPEIKSGCFICKVEPGNRQVIVSPTGKSHHTKGYGMTECGKDATGDGWWWPL